MAMHKGKMKKKGMARGGATMKKKKGYAKGGAKMPMVKKGGKMIPAFAADGKGKMNKGGMTKKKKGMAKGGAPKMTLAKLKAAAKKMGYKLVKM